MSWQSDILKQGNWNHQNYIGTCDVNFIKHPHYKTQVRKYNVIQLFSVYIIQLKRGSQRIEDEIWKSHDSVD